MKFKKESGFSLVEIMVTIGLIGGITLVVAELSKQGTKVTTKFEYDTELNLITNEINELLSDPLNCTPALKPSTLTPKGLVTSINGKFAAGNFYGSNSSVKINSYDLFIPNDATAPLSGQGPLKVNFLNKEILKGKGSGSRNIVTKIIQINYQLDPVTKELKSCKSVSAVSDIWKRTNDGKGIYYVGNVSINWAESNYNTNADENIDLDVRSLTKRTDGTVITTRADEKDPKTGVITTVAGGTIRGGKFLYISDKKFKKNVFQLDHSLEKILSLRGVSFDWKDTNKSDVGFIAQEVQKSIPEVVHQGSESLSVDYTRLVPFLVEAIKTQQIEINQLKKEIQESKRR